MAERKYYKKKEKYMLKNLFHNKKNPEPRKGCYVN